MIKFKQIVENIRPKKKKKKEKKTANQQTSLKYITQREMTTIPSYPSEL